MGNYRTCIFCNKSDSPPAREDVIANWIAREFPHTSWTIRRYTHDAIRNAKTDRRYVSLGSLGMVSRKPCKRCNNTWMSNLEDRAKPLLLPLMHGERTVLSFDDRLTIVRWFIKTLILYEFLTTDAKYPKYWKPSERHALMDSLVVPGETAFFSARYIGSKSVTTREMRLPFTVKRRDNNRTFPVEGYTATFAIKQLALQVFSVRWPEDPEMSELRWEIPGNWDEAVIPIWPFYGDVVWPPPFHLNDETLDLFTRRWRTVIGPPP